MICLQEKEQFNELLFSFETKNSIKSEIKIAKELSKNKIVCGKRKKYLKEHFVSFSRNKFQNTEEIVLR